MDTSTDNRRTHSLFTRWPRVQIRYSAHGLSLSEILTFGNRKQPFNSLKLDNKALTWQYPADLVFWLLLTSRHTRLPNNTLSYSATLVRWFILDHPIRASWPAHCRLLTNGFDQLTSSPPPSLSPTAFDDNTSVHHCTPINFYNVPHIFSPRFPHSYSVHNISLTIFALLPNQFIYYDVHFCLV